MQNVLVVVNKDEGVLGPSETFLRLHIDKVKNVREALVGNPGRRRFHHSGEWLQPQGFVYKVIKNLCRKAFGDDSYFSDTQTLARYLKSANINIVLAEYGSTGAGVRKACNLARVKLVVHFHGWDAYSKHMLDAYMPDYQLLFEQAALIIAVSNHMKRQLEKLGCPADKIVVNPCGADIERDIIRSPGVSVNNFVMVGRLTPKKAPLLSAKAFLEVNRRSPETRLHIIGDGPLHKDLENFVTLNDLQDKVVFHGAQNHDYVIQELVKSDCFLQHSVTAEDGDREGTPVSVLEAMMIGLPVIATRHGGISDVIEHKRTGFLVDEYDVEDMINQMDFVIQNPGVAFGVGELARKHILDNHTAAKSLEGLNKAIATV